MGEIYTVKKGDYLSKIAFNHKISDWKKIYNHEKNASLKKSRPDPDLLKEGDEIYIPDKNELKEQFKTGKKHEIKVKKQTKPTINIQISELGESLQIKKYELELDGDDKETITRTLDDSDFNKNLKQGKIIEDLSFKHENGLLKIWIEDEETDEDKPHFEFNIEIGGLDPIETISGLQARFNNLGYDFGDITDELDDKTTAVIKDFQKSNDLSISGKPDSNLEKKLKELHGC